MPNETDYEQQLRIVMGLRISVFQSNDPAGNPDLSSRLAEEEKKLLAIKQALPQHGPDAVSGPDVQGHRLGAATTQLTAETTLCMQPLPTGIYHLLNPETEPLLKVTVKNLSENPRRIRVRAGIEGVSTEAVRTVELTRKSTAGSERTLPLLPALLPGHSASMSEVQRATIYVISEDLDGKIEAHDTYSILCLSRNSSFNAVRDPSGAIVDLSHYYGAWVTPYDELVQERIRYAAGLCNPPQIWGYQGTRPDVQRQVEALFRSLQDLGITYVNSVIDYGAPDGYYTQRTRLPHESLRSRSANCIDGTVLMASLLEGASLNPALVLVPGHALVGWEAWRQSGEWKFLETIMIGQGKFDEACQSAQKLYEDYSSRDPKLVKQHSLRDLRRRGIWPMA
jgi:hypothetical protein